MISLQVILLQLRRVQDAHGFERGQPQVFQAIKAVKQGKEVVLTERGKLIA
jgi:hypothetical protein